MLPQARAEVSAPLSAVRRQTEEAETMPKLTEDMAADILCPVCKQNKLRMPYAWTWGRKFICDGCGADGHVQLEGPGVPYFCCVVVDGHPVAREDWARVGAELGEAAGSRNGAR